MKPGQPRRHHQGPCSPLPQPLAVSLGLLVVQCLYDSRCCSSAAAHLLAHSHQLKMLLPLVAQHSESGPRLVATLRCFKGNMHQFLPGHLPTDACYCIMKACRMPGLSHCVTFAEHLLRSEVPTSLGCDRLHAMLQLAVASEREREEIQLVHSASTGL